MALQMCAISREAKGASSFELKAESSVSWKRAFSASRTGFSVSAILFASFSMVGPACKSTDSKCDCRLSPWECQDLGSTIRTASLLQLCESNRDEDSDNEAAGGVTF